ncbi:ModE family transcriptional regulator [Sphingomonas sp. 1P06PA]|uniref:winged helix-turn-helix domain-containing protein n=1 Tax=Sphingomonas sp. 1P06PA TaxID=554121 RepID=UPI0039A4C1C4
MSRPDLTQQEPHASLRLRVHLGGEIAIGPGKAALLEAIVAHGSISAGARAMGMSYRRAWLLVDAMNRAWPAPLVETAAGGSRGGGARLSALGRDVLDRYRRLEAELEAVAARSDLLALGRHIAA